ASLPQGGGAFGAPPAAPGTPPTKEQCIATFDEAQRLHAERKLLLARDRLVEGAQTACPTVLRRDCVHTLSEVDALVPSTLPSWKDAAGHDIQSVRVTVDGTRLTTNLEGKPFPLDPGPHVVRFEADGLRPVEEKIVLRDGEKNRSLAVVMAPSSPRTDRID